MLSFAVPVCRFKSLGNQISGSLLDFHVCFSDVFSDHADGNQLDSADQKDDDRQRGPAGHRISEEFRMKHIQQDRDAYKQGNQPGQRDHPYRAYAE